MANEVPNLHDMRDSEAGSLTGLVSGIVNDLQELFKQQIALFKHELREELRQTAMAAVSCVLGGVVCAVGTLLFAFGIVHLLSWGTELPLWGSFLIFAAVFLVVGGILAAVGAAKFKSIKPPAETAEALKENVQWIMKPK
jgi:uncharacterized membrane protein